MFRRRFLADFCEKCRKKNMSWAIINESRQYRLLAIQAGRTVRLLTGKSCLPENFIIYGKHFDISHAAYQRNMAFIPARRFVMSVNRKGYEETGEGQSLHVTNYTPDWSLKHVEIACCKIKFVHI